MNNFKEIKDRLRRNPKIWLITGVAGFIGSNLLEELLLLDQSVRGIDNFSTGKIANLEDVNEAVGAEKWERFHFMEGDITNFADCLTICKGTNYVLHQAALGSVPRSIDDPINTNKSNIDGFVNMLVAARDNKVDRFVFAASSSTYGNHPDLPKVEEVIGKPLSPYAVTKYVNELYADVFSSIYGIETIGLRYFNVFGKRQDPNGAYAAVIPKWMDLLLNGVSPTINGDGKTSRDFCYIKNAIQANILAATSQDNQATNKIYNIAYGEKTSLNQLFDAIKENFIQNKVDVGKLKPKYAPFRVGDVRHSLADISRAKNLLGYLPKYSLIDGLLDYTLWFINNAPKQQ